MLKLLIAVAILVAATVPAAAAPQSPGAFARRWAFRLDQRALIILDLAPTPDGRNLTGSLSRPARVRLGMSGKDASEISGPVISHRIQAATVAGGVLHLTVADEADPSHPTLFTFSLVGGEAGDLAFVGAPMSPPMRLVRAAPAEVVASDWDPGRMYRSARVASDNPVVARLFAADQADRQDISHIDWDRVTKADALRREQVAALLRDGQLHTGADFMDAAFVFQHGATPGDYLMAHTLALAAMKEGAQGASWIAAATLDRYLISIGQKQIYGTQSRSWPKTGETTQEPYDRSLISDALRSELDVPTQALQNVQLKAAQRLEK